MIIELAPFLWLCGASGVGKSSIGWETFCQLDAAGVKSAYFDFDQVGFCRPAPPDDPENHRITAKNLAVHVAELPRRRRPVPRRVGDRQQP